MHCVYCGVDYSSDEPCLCMPPVRSSAEGATKVKGVWGDAAMEWSLDTAIAELLFGVRCGEA